MCERFSDTILLFVPSPIIPFTIDDGYGHELMMQRKLPQLFEKQFEDIVVTKITGDCNLDLLTNLFSHLTCCLRL